MKHISTKLLIGMFSLVAIMLIVLWTFQIVFFETSYIKGKADELQAKTETLKVLIEENGNYNSYISEIGALYNIGVLVADTYGIPVYASRGFSSALLQDTLGYVDEVSGGKTVRDHVISERYNLHYVRIGVPIEGGGALFLALPVSDVSDTVGILKRQVLDLSIVLIALCAVFVFVFSKSFTKQILSIEKQAGNMAKGDLQTPFVATTKDELGRLTNTMENLRVSLMQVDRLSKELIANVSHELRTPLSIIRGFAETVRDITWKNDEKRNTQLNAIVEESVRLERVVNDILDYSQLQSGKVHYRLEKVDLSDIAARTCARMNSYFENGGLNLTTDIENEANIMGDETKLEQLMVNLLGNTFNHTPPGKNVCVRVKKKGALVTLEVEDEGEGIAQEELPNIWDRYYKATLRGREERMGTGLGLAICKAILDAHDARYMVASEVNAFTRVSVEFDAAE